MEEQLAQLEKEVQEIRNRNLRVETDKAWETSKTRIGSICAITYFVAFALLSLLHTVRPWLNALVPVMGFYLSSRSLPEIKQWWQKHIYKNSSI